MLFDFIAIDFETANNNINSACSLGLAMVKNNSIVDTKYFLIKPPYLFFNIHNTKIHGLTKKDVLDSPRFPKIWKEISPYFDDNILIAHNANFDMSVLKLTLEYYNLDMAKFKYADSMLITTKACGNDTRKGLAARAKFFDFDFPNHHNALADAEMCAKIVIETIKACNESDINSFFNKYHDIIVKDFADLIPISSFDMFKRKNFKISELTPLNNIFDTNNSFYNKIVAFTGDLKSMTRRQAMQKIVDLGGTPRNNVSSNTDYLVIGYQEKYSTNDKGISSKHEKALKLIESGNKIEIIDEFKFLEFLDS